MVKKPIPFIRTCILLVLLIIVLFFADIVLGSVWIPIDEIFQVLIGGESEKSSWQNIILQFRLPRALTGILVGSALSVSGLQLQTLFRNPLAGPYVLGISTGASLGVAIAVMSSVFLGGILSQYYIGNWIIIIASTLGSGLVLLMVLSISFRVRDSMTLLIVGLMFGSISGAIVSMLQFFSSAQQLQVFVIWTMGSLGGLTWQELSILSIVVIIGIAISISQIKPLNAFLLTENYARTLGINIKRARFWIIISTSLLAGGITAFCGPIAFIGLAVPHLTRPIFNTSDHKILVPAVVLSGIIIMLTCDIISQLPGSQHILPINAITSLIGAPVVIWIIIRKGGIKKSFAG